VLLAGGCADRTPGPEPGGAGKPGAAATDDWFVDGTTVSGLDFVHFNGMSGDYQLPEIMGPGVGMLDYDNDGDLDVYIVQGHGLGRDQTPDEAVFPPRTPSPPRDRLYRNDLDIGTDGARTLRFTDVTDESGIDARGYGMGVATGDFDNDGWVDLYVTNFGPNQMWRNNGDGTFTDVTARTRTGEGQWSVSASFADFDRDGWLDLYVANYVNYQLEPRTECFTSVGEPDYCGPQNFDPVPDRLFRNQGDGTFLDVTTLAQISRARGPALGVVATDINSDGWIDFYVANDGAANHAWLNQRNRTFRDVALAAGIAVNANGWPEGSMGVDAGDFDGDGDEDLAMTHLVRETNTVYVNDGSGFFEDRSAATGLGPPSLPFTGFGTGWFDFDNDGRLDLLAVNGAVKTIEALAREGDPFPLHQRNQLFHNLGDGRFEDVTDRAGKVFELSEVSRGAAFGDLDNDGDIDLVVGNNAGPARLLINNVGHRRHWIGLRLAGADARRDMLGARVAVVRADGPPLWRRVRSDGSYASANDSRVLVGLGDAPAVRGVRVVWPGGRVEEWSDVAIDAWTTLTEGTGSPSNEDGP